MSAVSNNNPKGSRFPNSANNVKFRSISSNIATRERSCGICLGSVGNTGVSVQLQQSSRDIRRDNSNHKSNNFDEATIRQNGFVDGNFSAGKVLDLKLKDKSYCMAYDRYGDTFVVGTATSLDFYDSSSYDLIHSVPQRSMISAVAWVASPLSCRSNDNDLNLEENSRNRLLATSDLDGMISLYSADLDILESQGPTLLYSGSNASGAQIRSLDAGFYSCAGHRSLVIAAGDKGGAVTVVSFEASSLRYPVYADSMQMQLWHKQDLCMENEVNKSGILGLAINCDQGMMAVSSSGGLVQVVSLSNILMEKRFTIGRNGDVLWSSQNNGGAIRCVVFGNNVLAFGGYDKIVTLVDTQQWTVSRELMVQGTV
jgi:hypothetical protein